MATLHQVFLDHGMLVGTTSSYMAGLVIQMDQEMPHFLGVAVLADEEEEDGDDNGPVQGDPTSKVFITNLAAKHGMWNLIPHSKWFKTHLSRIWLSTRVYSRIQNDKPLGKFTLFPK